jgi:outer membrane immunogenic protein
MHRVPKLLAASAVLAAFAQTASAADLPPYRPPLPPMAVPFSWTGFYIGAHAGSAWFLKEQTFTTGVPALVVNDNNYVGTGFLGGGQVGFNYQVASWVLGAEAQFSWADLEGKDNCVIASPIALVNCRTKVDWLGTVAGRLGFAFDRTMVFVTGGGAWVHDNYDTSFFATPFPNIHVEDTRWGWMFGTGVEHAFFGNWSAKVEYDYLDFGTKTVAINGAITPVAAAAIPASFGVQNQQHINEVKAGINWRFAPNLW